MKTSLKTIGAKMKDLREKSDLTQKNIAEYLCVDQSLISKFESGERHISVDGLEKLSSLYGCNLSFFTDDKNISKTLSFAFRASDMTQKDMNVISAINKIALNSDFMDRLLKDGVH